MNVAKDFPKLDVIYVDSACMSLRPLHVIRAINEYYLKYPACAGRSHHKLGVRVATEVEKARKKITNFFGAKKDEIVFTKNATEGINIIANGLKLKKVLVSDKEHNSNLIPWLNKGMEVVICKSKEDNTFDLKDFEKKVKKVDLVSVVYTSNLDGVTNPIKEIVKIAHKNSVRVLVDAAQAAAHVDIDVHKLDIDFMVCSAHKMCGPSGVGVLYGKKHLLEEVSSFIVGGDTVSNSNYDNFVFEAVPKRFEAGLQDYPGIIGFGAAVDYLSKIGLNKIEKHVLALNEFLSSKLLTLKGFELIGPQAASQRSGIISFNLKGKDPHEVALMLDTMANICVRSGQHCVHSWFNAHNMNGSVRISLYFYNTFEECEKIFEEIKKISEL